MIDGPLFMHLLLIHLNDLLDSNSFSIALVKEEIRLVKEVFKFLRSFFMNLELIKEEVSNISEKIPKNKSLVVVNSTKNPVERKSLTTGNIIVGFKEETNWLISKLTSGPKDLDVISITAMKKLYGKRYLIVLDDVWDIDTWDELTRPFPKVVNGSRIIFKTRQKEVAFHGKCNTDPLNLRLLSSEESWELLEKRAFGKESCPEEILDVGKEIALNCKGLPLVVDLIAGVIVGREKTKSVWLEVRNNLNSFILNSNHPTCQIHGLVHDFCLIKARQEKLLGKISSSDPSSSSDLMPRIVTIFSDKEHCGPNNFVLLNSKKKRHSGKHLCSLLITADEMEDRLSDACRVRDFKLLRMLDLSPSFMLVKYSLLNDRHVESFENILPGRRMEHGKEDTFENHKYLELEEVTLAKWEVGEEFFPSPQLEDSVQEIKQYVEDMTGEDKLQILGPNNIPLCNLRQFTPPSWCAAAIPNTASLLLPNASVFNCNKVTEKIKCNKKWDIRSPKSLNCDAGAAVSNDQDVQIGAPDLIATAQHGYQPPSLMSTLLLFLCQESSRSIKYRIDELNEVKSVI
ncbi:hypothetical protein BC332_14884 [Capsicum chinense]|nr:hypothetical protein BC332_14884 [Capsicum chinense]